MAADLNLHMLIKGQNTSSTQKKSRSERISLNSTCGVNNNYNNDSGQWSLQLNKYFIEVLRCFVRLKMLRWIFDQPGTLGAAHPL